MLLVRHGESIWNAERRIQGQLDPPLSDEGRRQADRLALRLSERLAGRTPAGLYSSDLRRAMETARIIGAAVGLEPTPDPALREIYLGEWEGLRTDELATRYPEAWTAWAREPDWDLVPGGEGAAAFESRAGAAVDALMSRANGAEVIAVTHGGVIQVALHRVVGRGSRGLFQFKIQNTSISIIEERNGRSIIAGVNDVSHLEPDHE